VREGSTVRAAASKFFVPKSTVQNHLRIQEISTIKGAPLILNQAKEQKIIDWIVGLIEKGVPCGSIDVLESGRKLIK
jgi:predicted nucleotidyltransferase